MINPDGFFFGDTLISGCLIFIVHLHCCQFEGLGIKLLLTTFWHVISNKRKKSRFSEIRKKRKLRMLEHWLRSAGWVSTLTYHTAAYCYTGRTFCGLRVCLPLCWVHRWTVPNRLNRSQPVWRADSRGPKKPGLHSGATRWIQLNDPCAAAMRPYTKLPWPLAYIIESTI